LSQRNSSSCWPWRWLVAVAVAGGCGGGWWLWLVTVAVAGDCNRGSWADGGGPWGWRWAGQGRTVRWPSSP